MAGTIIADKIQTENSFLTLNVGQTQVASLNAGGIYSATGTKIIGTDGSITQSNTLYVGANASSTVGGATNPIIGAILSANNYVQNYIYNPSNTALASADIACYPNNGSDANGWIDMGITSNTYSYSAYPITGRNEGYLLMSAPGGSGTSGNLVFATDSTGTHNSIQFYTGGFNQPKSNAKVTITGSGQVAVGTSVPGSLMQLNGNTAMGTGTATQDILTITNQQGVLNGVANDKFGIVISAMTDLSDRRVGIYNVASNVNFNNPDLSFWQSGQGISYREVARLKASSTGLLFLGMSNFNAGPSATNAGLQLGNTNNACQSYAGGNTTQNHWVFGNLNGGVGGISTLNSSTTFSTSSDYRLKKNVTNMTGALEKVGLLRPVEFTWKKDNISGQGFIAHELQAVIPESVVGEKDETEVYIDDDGIEKTRPKYQSVDTSFLVATLTAAIQELKAIVDAQAVEIAALKAK